MKHFDCLWIALLAISVFTFSSCSDDNPDTIEGLWNFTNIQSSNCTDSYDNGEIDLSGGCIDLILAEICSATIDFRSDGTFEVSVETTTLGIPTTDSDTGTYTVSGNNLTMCDSSGNNCDTGTFILSGSQLTGNYTDPNSGCDTQFVAER